MAAIEGMAKVEVNSYVSHSAIDEQCRPREAKRFALHVHSRSSSTDSSGGNAVDRASDSALLAWPLENLVTKHQFPIIFSIEGLSLVNGGRECGSPSPVVFDNVQYVVRRKFLRTYWYGFESHFDVTIEV